MSLPESENPILDPKQTITDFVGDSSGLKMQSGSDIDSLAILQQSDGKTLTFEASKVDEVLSLIHI